MLLPLEKPVWFGEIILGKITANLFTNFLVMILFAKQQRLMGQNPQM